MIDTRNTQRTLHGTILLMVVCLCLVVSSASADGLMPMMPAPPDTPVYWQLQSVAQEPMITPSAGFSVDYGVSGLSLDLADGLLTQSLLESDPSLSPSLSLTILNGHAMWHTYTWTALPIYLVPDTAYPIDVTGTADKSGKPLNSLMAIYTQGSMNARISADGYTGHVASASFVINPSETPLYNDGSLVISFVLRDVNDMFRMRIAYTYAMVGGIKPEPTPIPGFVAVDMPKGVLPTYYDAVEGHEALWAVTTAKDEYRAYGSMSGSEPMFFPADKNGKVVMDEKPASPQKDYDKFVKGFVPVDAVDVPAYYKSAGESDYTFTTRDGEVLTRAFGRINGGEPAFYPADETGAVAEDATKIDPAEDYTTFIEGFGAAQPPAPFAHYEAVSDDLYAFTGRDGQTRYRVFGRLDGNEPAYYEATPEGQPVKNAAAILPDSDFEAYIKGFDATAPADADVPAYYERVSDGLFAVTDRVGEKLFRVYGVKDGQLPAFYAADAEGTVAEDAQPVAPSTDFDQYVAGFDPITLDEADAPLYYNPTENPNVWTFTDVNGSTHYRAYGILNRGDEAFYPSDAEGNVTVDALPALPAADLAIIPPPEFVEVTPDAVPEIYAVVRDGSSLYAFSDREGESVYRVYGAYGRQMPRFYPADAEGKPVEDADPVDPAIDFETYFEGFEPQTPKTVPPQYTLVDESRGLYSLATKTGETLYRVYGVLNRAAVGFYVSDEQGTPLSADVIDPQVDTALAPTSVAYSVVTSQPQGDSAATPLARTYTAEPDPTTLTSGVHSTQVPADGTNVVVGREYTPQPNPTEFSAGVATPGTTGDGGAQTVGRVLPPATDPTSFASAILPTDGPSETEEPIIRVLPENTDEQPSTVVSAISTPASADASNDPLTVTITPTPEQTEETTTTPETDGTTTPGATEATDGTVPPTIEPDPATVEPTQTTAEDASQGLSTGWIAAIVAGIGVVAGGGYALLRKKKK